MDTGSPKCEVSDTQVSDPPVVLSYFNLHNTSHKLASIWKKRKPQLTGLGSRKFSWILIIAHFELSQDLKMCGHAPASLKWIIYSQPLMAISWTTPKLDISTPDFLALKSLHHTSGMIAIKSTHVPCSLITPSSMTSIWSACIIVLSLCATTIVVLLAQTLSNDLNIFLSVCVSSADVAYVKHNKMKPEY